MAVIQFNGILNNSGNQINLSIEFDLDRNDAYSSYAYLEGIETKAVIYGNYIQIHEDIYRFDIQNTADEILVIGKEVDRWYHYFSHWLCCFPSLKKRKFFLLSNKQHV
jgi:hypothetical protein